MYWSFGQGSETIDFFFLNGTKIGKEKNNTAVIREWHDLEQRKSKRIYKLLDLIRNSNQVIGIQVKKFKHYFSKTSDKEMKSDI